MYFYQIVFIISASASFKVKVVPLEVVLNCHHMRRFTVKMSNSYLGKGSLNKYT